jgi:hypothetical protein
LVGAVSVEDCPTWRRIQSNRRLAARDAEHDLAALAPLGHTVERRPGISEREYGVDLWPDCAYVREPCELDELVTVRLDDEVGDIGSSICAISSRFGAVSRAASRPLPPSVCLVDLLELRDRIHRSRIVICR